MNDICLIIRTLYFINFTFVKMHITSQSVSDFLFIFEMNN